jgi:hypothetical protein
LTMRRPKSKDGTMVHRSSKVVIALLSLFLVLVSAGPVSAYGKVNRYDLRLTLLDPLACGTPMRLQALLTQNGGTPASGITVQFSIAKGAGDTVSPASVATNGAGIAITRVTIACDSQPPHQVLASVANDASARITLCGSAQSCMRETRQAPGPAVTTPHEASGPSSPDGYQRVKFARYGPFAS